MAIVDMDLSDVLVVVALAWLVATVLWGRHRRLRQKMVGEHHLPLPPGPPGWPVVGNLFQVALQRRPFMYVVRDLRKQYGPIFTLQMGQRTLIVITSSDLIHEALVQKGPIFASRPPDSPTRLLFSAGKCTVNSAEYGPLWRTLRRNFVGVLVSPSRIRSFGWIREWAIANHLARLRTEYATKGEVSVMANCRLTICSILSCICFGCKVPENRVRKIEGVLKEVMMMTTLKLPDFLPVLSPIFMGTFKAARELRRRQMDCLLPMIRARKAFLDSSGDTAASPEFEMMSPPGESYVDSLFSLHPAERGKLREEEIVTLCSEVMSAGTDTSATALEWSLFHLVLDQSSQQKLYDEIVAVSSPAAAEAAITEEEVEKMVYLQAVVKETLRRHPPSHFVLSHAATMDTELGGFRIPSGVNVEFYTAWVTEDPEAWRDPGEWRPERFLEGGEGYQVDVTGTRGVHMMPFGVGRRICPAANLGMLHVQLMLARMVKEFRWIPPPSGPPDSTETFAFTVVMKEPLKAAVINRSDVKSFAST